MLTFNDTLLMPSLVMLHANSRFDKIASELTGTIISITVGSQRRSIPLTKNSYVIPTVALDNPVDRLTCEIVALGIFTIALAMPLRTGNEIPDCSQSRENGSASQI